MKTSLAALLAALTAAAAVPGAKPSLYTDGQYGFSIQAPAFGPAEGPVVPVMLLGPSEDGFAPNLNVVVENGTASLKDYAELTRRQFEAADLKLLSETAGKGSGRDAVTWEYEGNMNGRELRWIARAISAKDRIYLVTCTSLRKNFEKSERAFRDSLESFKLEE